MKKYLFIAAVLLSLTQRGLAQWAVFDAANLSQNVANYAAMVEQISKQAEQITNQVRQIQQMEDQLKRLGNMADIKALVGFPELKLDMNLPTKIKTWSENLTNVNGSGLFGDTRGGVYQPVSDQFTDFDGAPISRDANTYKPAQAITTQVDNFKDVQSDVYSRREALKAAINETSDALQAATTDAEEKKLSAVLDAQYSQLAALDSEVQLSAAEIQAKVAENNAMTDAQNAADAEARRKLAQQEAQKISTTFKPIYDSILRYVEERPLTR